MHTPALPRLDEVIAAQLRVENEERLALWAAAYLERHGRYPSVAAMTALREAQGASA